jgi:TonB family protein
VGRLLSELGGWAHCLARVPSGMKTLELTYAPSLELPPRQSGERSAALAPETVGRGLVHPRVEVSRFTSVLTLVLWLGAAVVGVMGLTLSYARPHAGAAVVTPLTVEMLHVELTAEPLPEIQSHPALAETLATPPPADAVLQPQLPPAIAVALPSPQIAFAVPVEGPTQIVEVAHAGYSANQTQTTATETTALPVQPLTFGHGAGRQPAPDYPLRAQREKQEGVVSVRFTVGENGRVAAAEAVNASPWPLLNESAVRTIRSRWRFAPGAPRAYEVAIRFVLPDERP